jgi:hypothetical protein
VSWRDRLLQMALAGGAFSLTACGGGSLPDPTGQAGQTGGPCGNANPDPCICGRPDVSAEAKALCDDATACRAAGGVFIPYAMIDTTTGTTVPPHCEVDGGAGADAAATSDGGSDGV